MYPSSLDNVQWTILQAYLPKPKKLGRPRLYSFRDIFDGMFYVLRSGCAWSMMPNDFPSHKTVYHYYRTFKNNGLLERICHALRERLRRKIGRNEQPSAAIIDSQSAKSIDQPGSRGFDANKKVKGRKRHVIVDSEGFLLMAYVHEADIPDCRGAEELMFRLMEAGFMDLELMWSDQGYRGSLIEWTRHYTWWKLEVIRKSTYEGGFHIQPRRWVIERTFGWFSKYRRMARDYEQLPCSSEAMLYLAMIHILLKRMHRSK